MHGAALIQLAEVTASDGISPLAMTCEQKNGDGKMNATGYKFFVAIGNGIRLPVREDRETVRRDMWALGDGAKIIPLLTRDAMPLIAADRQCRFVPAHG